jgi:hypothetical protein
MENSGLQENDFMAPWLHTGHGMAGWPQRSMSMTPSSALPGRGRNRHSALLYEGGTAIVHLKRARSKTPKSTFFWQRGRLAVEYS